jgi:ribosomal protein L20A (L18A)
MGIDGWEENKRRGFKYTLREKEACRRHLGILEWVFHEMNSKKKLSRKKRDVYNIQWDHNERLYNIQQK